MITKTFSRYGRCLLLAGSVGIASLTLFGCGPKAHTGEALSDTAGQKTGVAPANATPEGKKWIEQHAGAYPGAAGAPGPKGPGAGR